MAGMTDLVECANQTNRKEVLQEIGENRINVLGQCIINLQPTNHKASTFFQERIDKVPSKCIISTHLH